MASDLVRDNLHRTPIHCSISSDNQLIFRCSRDKRPFDRSAGNLVQPLLYVSLATPRVLGSCMCQAHSKIRHHLSSLSSVEHLLLLWCCGQWLIQETESTACSPLQSFEIVSMTDDSFTRNIDLLRRQTYFGSLFEGFPHPRWPRWFSCQVPQHHIMECA